MPLPPPFVFSFPCNKTKQEKKLRLLEPLNLLTNEYSRTDICVMDDVGDNGVMVDICDMGAMNNIGEMGDMGDMGDMDDTNDTSDISGNGDMSQFSKNPHLNKTEQLTR